RLRLEVGDDYWLGRLLKRAGARQRIWFGNDAVLCPWHRGTWNVVRGLEKNFFAGCGYSTALVLLTTLAQGAAHFGPLAVLAAAACVEARPAARIAACAPLALQAALLLGGRLLHGRRHGTRWSATALVPLGHLLVLVALWNSTIRTLFRGGIVWR